MLCFLHTPNDRQPILPQNLGLERPQLEVPHELRGQMNPEDLTETETGLLIPGSRRDQILSATRQILVPESARMNRNNILTPDEETVQKLGRKEDQDEKPVRPIREILVLGSNPRAFIIQEVMKEYGVHTAKELPPTVSDVLVDLDPDEVGEPSAAATLREERTKYQGKDGYNYTVPGPLEFVGLKISAAMADQSIKEALGDSKSSEPLAMILKDLLAKYRLQTLEKVEFLPEMPDLMDQLLIALDTAHVNRNLRYLIYDCLEQIKIPSSRIEDVLWRMDENRDLHHPLSFQLTTEIMSHPQAAESTWLQSQEQRRDELLQLLSDDPQNLLDQYADLKRLAKRIVIPTDPFNPSTGKIGLEFEFSKPERPLDQPIGPEWEEGVDNPDSNPDGKNPPEMRRDINALGYNAEYIRSVGHLSNWFRDNAQHLSSMHIHLDRNVHPNSLDLGQVLGNPNKIYRRGRNFNTNEVRGLFVPFDTRQRNRLDSSAVISAIELYISAAAEPDHPDALLHATPDIEYSWEQLTFGYITSHLSSPEGRLAALKTLEHPLMFKSIDPYSIIQGFDDESKQVVLKNLDRETKGNFQKLSLVRAMYERPDIFLPEILEYLNAEHEQTEKEYLVRSITSQGDEFAATIDQIATFPDHYVRAAVAKFWASNPIKFQAKLEKLYATDPSWRVRSEIVGGWATDLGKYRNKLKEVLQTDPDRYVRRLVLRTWFDKPNLFRNDILEAYKTQPEGVRITVVQFWADKYRSYSKELQLALQDPDEDVRTVAEEAVAANT